MFKNEDSKLSKAAATKERLFQIALDLFAKEGFEATTMRTIAAKADTAPGAIYYHFPSKESLVHEYYRKSHLDHLNDLNDRLEKETSFEKRLHLVIESKMRGALPYKDMARSLFRSAANPESELSPFSPESKELRDASIQIFEQVVAGSKDKFSDEVRGLLPKYLWLYQMGIILFWIYDTSAASKRTFQLIDQTVPLIAGLNQQLMSPLARPFRKKIISILQSNAPDFG